MADFPFLVRDRALKAATRRAFLEAFNTLYYFIDDSNITSLNASKITTGVLASADGKTYFDLDNKRVIVNDGTNDRVLLGLF